jgi:hypothetical protein
MSIKKGGKYQLRERGLDKLLIEVARDRLRGAAPCAMRRKLHAGHS